MPDFRTLSVLAVARHLRKHHFPEKAREGLEQTMPDGPPLSLMLFSPQAQYNVLSQREGIHLPKPIPGPRPSFSYMVLM